MQVSQILPSCIQYTGWDKLDENIWRNSGWKLLKMYIKYKTEVVRTNFTTVNTLLKYTENKYILTNVEISSV